MRWKEHFLVPDHTIKDINGASFAGFYYICFQKSAATIEGYYYHRSSEWYDCKLCDKLYQPQLWCVVGIYIYICISYIISKLQTSVFFKI